MVHNAVSRREAHGKSDDIHIFWWYGHKKYLYPWQIIIKFVSYLYHFFHNRYKINWNMDEDELFELEEIGGGMPPSGKDVNND